MDDQQAAAAEAARHELVTLDGLAVADGAAPSESFVKNCLMIRRSDQNGHMFFGPSPDKLFARLDGYAIIPIEEYYALLPGKSLPTLPPDPSTSV